MSTEPPSFPKIRDEPRWQPPEVSLPIASQDGYEAAGAAVVQTREFIKHVEEWFAPLKRKAFEAHKALTDREKLTLAPVRDFEARIKRALTAYHAEQEQLRREEELRLEEEARQREEEQRLADAEALDAEGRAEGDDTKVADAVALLDEPITTPVVRPPAPPQPKGISYRETWRAEVTDERALIRHVAEHPEHANLLKPNLPALNSLARSLKGAMNIPGVKSVGKKEVTTRTAR